MIAYRALRPTLNEPNGREGDADSPEPIVAPCDQPHDLIVATAPQPSFSIGDAPLIAIIDPRTLGRDSLARALEATESRWRSHSFPHLAGWLGDGRIRQETSMVLLGIGATDADDPALAEDLQFLVRDFAHIPTIVMGDAEAPSHIVRILGYGARGYIPTSVSLTVAISAISLARAGGLFVPASSFVLSQQMPLKQPAAFSPVSQLLTERQAAVAEAISRGKANKTIAYELKLCESTVKVHVRSIMRKLQARNRTEVAFKLHSLAPRCADPARNWSSARSV
jgi:DNA-binding NarL/FixJ family response regulator